MVTDAKSVVKSIRSHSKGNEESPQYGTRGPIVNIITSDVNAQMKLETDLNTTATNMVFVHQSEWCDYNEWYPCNAKSSDNPGVSKKKPNLFYFIFYADRNSWN